MRLGVILSLGACCAGSFVPTHELKTWTPEVKPPVSHKYFYPPEFLQDLDGATQRNTKLQRDEDRKNAKSVPLLDYDAEVITLPDGSTETVYLGKMIGQQKYSTLFKLRDHPDKVIKYHVNCSPSVRQGIHPLLRDYWALRTFRVAGTVVKAHFISPPVKFENRRTRKTNFALPDIQFRECAKDNRSSVRYVLMDLAYSSLYDVAYRGGVDLKGAILVMRSLVDKLRSIHARGLVHADVHAANVMFSDPARTQLAFIDFASSFFVHSWRNKPDQVFEPLTYVNGLSSPYLLRGFRPSYRDDVFNAITIGSFLLNGPVYETYTNGLESDGEAMLRFKDQEFLFSIPGAPDKIASYPFASVHDRLEVVSRLQQVLDLVRSVEDINQKPDYNSIIGALTIALNHL